jgi:hypothetical protein
MAISTSMQPRQFWTNSIYAVVCLVFALWGYYDYTVKYPDMQKAFDEHKALSDEKTAIEATKKDQGSLDPAQVTRYEELEAKLKEYKEAPVAPGKYDMAIQLWLYIVGCGVMGTPYFLWNLFAIRRRSYRLEDDGTLVLPEGTCRIDELKGLDMSRWMSKSIATITMPDGRDVDLDDYKFKNMDRIVGAIANHFEPGQWTDEVKPVKPGEEPAGAGEEVREDAAASDGQ